MPDPIKAIITDVDGVMVGKTEGIDFPLPRKNVIDRLKKISKDDIPVVLCTAKFGDSVKQIVIEADLHNPHITDGGALIIDYVGNTTIKSHLLNNKIVNQFTEETLNYDIYTEIYTPISYFVQKSQLGSLLTNV
ncbi:HAD hydrolase family protein [Candidatus Parcubacteria bacterium]|nr:HAD hydrolase family protein [Candidatus Parcubacteria bacterium]